ncbi:MAG: hypothetical protein H6581_23255 [Bacteroidia bacterium]|nr:hypothetical protein [Bacteroidia bacterium]
MPQLYPRDKGQEGWPFPGNQQPPAAFVLKVAPLQAVHEANFLPEKYPRGSFSPFELAFYHSRTNNEEDIYAVHILPFLCCRQDNSIPPQLPGKRVGEHFARKEMIPLTTGSKGSTPISTFQTFRKN